MPVVSIKKFDYIDALRGIAIIMVMMVHTSHRVAPGKGLASDIMTNGGKGVQLFYIISALTLCFSLRSRKQKESKYILYFFIRRFFRIAPLFYVAMFFYLYLYNVGGNYYMPNGLKNWYIIAAGFFMHGWHPETINGIVPGSWSIAVEFTFYLSLPFIFCLIDNKFKAFLFLIVSIIAGSLITRWIYEYWSGIYPADQKYLAWGVSYYGFFNQLPVFATGILLYHIFQDNIFNSKRSVSIACVILSVTLMFSSDYLDNYINNLVIFAFAFALLTYALANYKLTFFVNRFTIYIGRISFGMYLFHFAVIKYFNSQRFFGLSEYSTYGTLIALLMVITATAFITTFTYYFIEKKGIKLGQTVINKIERRTVLDQ